MIPKRITLAIAVALGMGLAGCDEGAAGGGSQFAGLNTQSDSVSYSLGMDISNSIKEQGWEINNDAFYSGFTSGDAEGGGALLTIDQARGIIMNYQRTVQQKVRDEQGSENAAKGQAFLTENRGKAGVKELPSGLQYEVMAEGAGASPTLDDQVRIHYKGTLLDGTTFDSSYERGEPAVFQPRGLIKAWQEILPMMKPGAKYKIYSPPELAYGPIGSPPRIGPNETLVFEMELFEVIKQ